MIRPCYNFLPILLMNKFHVYIVSCFMCRILMTLPKLFQKYISAKLGSMC